MEKDFLKNINLQVINYLSLNGLIYETVQYNENEIRFYNYSSPLYEEEKESIIKELEHFYKIFDLLVFVEVEQPENNIGEIMTLTICQDIPSF